MHISQKNSNFAGIFVVKSEDPAGEVLHVRILPWHDYGEVKDSKYIGLRNVRIEGKAFDPAEGIDEVSSSLQGGDRGRLILRNGMLFIERSGIEYTLSGQIVK